MRKTFLLVGGSALLKRVKMERISKVDPGSHSAMLDTEHYIMLNFEVETSVRLPKKAGLVVFKFLQ